MLSCNTNEEKEGSTVMKNLKTEFCNFELEYTNKDKEYIDKVIQILNEKSEEVMDFFELKNLSKKVKIKFWNNVEEYKNFFNKSLKKYNKIIPDWEVARATNTLNECRIDILSLGESRKCRGHDNDSVENLIQIIVHEFVHICHFEYNNHTSTMTWFTEALATNLAGQNNCKKLICTLQDIMTETPKEEENTPNTQTDNNQTIEQPKEEITPTQPVQEEVKCTPKKFKNKYTYVYTEKEVCIQNGDQIDAWDYFKANNIPATTFGCEEITDECGDTYYGVYYGNTSGEKFYY